MSACAAIIASHKQSSSTAEDFTPSTSTRCWRRRNAPRGSAKWEIALRSVIERLFGVSDQQFVHNLQGNTQITKKVRQVTKSIAPPTQAIWTLPLLYERMCEWLYEVDTSLHGRLEQSPREAFESGMRTAGDRLHRMIRYDEAFRLTLPTTRGGGPG